MSLQLAQAVSFSNLWQVHRRVNPTQLQQEARGPAAGGAAVRHLDLGLGRGLTHHLRHQQRARPRPWRVQIGKQRLRPVLVCVLLLHPVSHHAAAVLRHVPRPEALGGGAEGQAEKQHPGLPQAPGGRRFAPPAGLLAAAAAAHHREGTDRHAG